jgi:hypothetical protein
MGKPHKHAELIKAWADGAEIQQRYDSIKEWQAIGQFPSWAENFEYRIKPNTVRYRLCLIDSYKPRVHVINYLQDEGIEKCNSFICWLGDWQEVEV